MNYLKKVEAKFKGKIQQSREKTHPRNYSMFSWIFITITAIKKIQNDNVSLLSAGIAFYFLLALFPMLAAIITLYSIFVNDATLTQHMQQLTGIIPADSRYIIEEQIDKLNEIDNSSLGMGFFAGLLFTIYSAGKGATGLITACNVTYLENDNRGFFKVLALRTVLTLSIMLTIVVFLVVIIVLPVAVDAIFTSRFNELIVKTCSWILLFVLSVILLSGLYRLAPDRQQAKWRWVTIGAVIASVLWIAGSFGFNFYISQVASYNDTYGSVGGIIVLLMWFYMSAFIVLLGAEINAASELMTAQDTTSGPNKPIGERGAYVADNEKRFRDK